MAEANKVVQLKPRAAEKAPVKKAAKKTVKKTASKKAPAKKATPKAATKTVKKTAVKKAAPKKTVAKKSPAKKIAAAKAAAKTITKKPAAKTVAKKPAVKKAAVKVAKKTTAPKATKKATPKKAVAKKVVAKKSASKKIATKKIAAKKTITKKTVKKAAVKKAIPKAAAPKIQAKPQAAPKTAQQFQTFFKSPKSTNPFNTKPLEAIMTQPNFEEAQKQFDQFTKEAANLNREGIDAFVKSGTIFAKGFENLMKETMSFAQTTAEKQMQLAKDAMTSKTINEFSDAQNKLAKTSFDDFMSGTTKITELGVKLLTESIDPISEQVQKSVQKAQSAAAAE